MKKIKNGIDNFPCQWYNIFNTCVTTNLVIMSRIDVKMTRGDVKATKKPYKKLKGRGKCHYITI